MTKLVQISDSHLFAGKSQLHHGVCVYQNLLNVFRHIKQLPDISAIIFTGDMTQDHTEQSYRNFVDCLAEANLDLPCYILAGNHDDVGMLKSLEDGQITYGGVAIFDEWQCLFTNSKGDTPAGDVSNSELNRLSKLLNQNKPTLLFMHHHASNVGYFIDRHGLSNRDEFWQLINQSVDIQAIACGHVHRGECYFPPESLRNLPLYACPSTSIQFDPDAESVKALPIGPGVRVFELKNAGQLTTELIYLKENAFAYEN